MNFGGLTKSLLLMTALVLTVACTGYLDEGLFGLLEKDDIIIGQDGGMISITDAELGSYHIDRFEFPNKAGELPKSFVGLQEAVVQCEAVGKRLCTAAEWRRACLGSEGKNRYGYGPDYQRGRCHVENTLPSGYTSTQNADLYTAPSGLHLNCETEDGVYDMIGNLEEWVLDDWQGLEGMLEGGAWYTMEWYADCSGRYSRQPDYRADPKQPVFSAGFRCCQSDAFIGWDDIQKDAKKRLKRAAATVSKLSYDTKNEIQVSEKLWIDQYEYPNQEGAYPLVAVNWNDANQLCQENNKRLCTAQEWQLACAGPEGSNFPYGDYYIPWTCPILLDEAPKSGEYSWCKTPSGIHDMPGGVWEWTSSPLNLKERSRTSEEAMMEVRGGSWYVDPLKARCIPAEGYPAAPTGAHYESVGFRCCRGDGITPESVTEIATVKAHETDSPSNSERCPRGMVYGDNVCIDSYEYPNKQGLLPKGNLNFEQAENLCRNKGSRLCTTDEWTSRCSSQGKNTWPYGNTFRPEACQFGISAMAKQSGQSVNSGDKPHCRTPDGIYDMSGNLWEWTISSLGIASLQGGGWNINSGLGMCAFTTHADRDYQAPEVGVRCCRDPL